MNIYLASKSLSDEEHYKEWVKDQDVSSSHATNLLSFASESLQGERVTLLPASQHEKRNKKKPDNKASSEASESDSSQLSIVTTIPTSKLVPTFTSIPKQRSSKFGNPRPSSAAKSKGVRGKGLTISQTLPNKQTPGVPNYPPTKITPKDEEDDGRLKVTTLISRSPISRGSIQRSTKRPLGNVLGFLTFWHKLNNFLV